MVTVTMKSLIVFVTAVIVSVTMGYKIRRSDCFMAEARDGEESSEMQCTCGGIGDPYSIIMNKVKGPCVLVPGTFTRMLRNHRIIYLDI